MHSCTFSPPIPTYSFTYWGQSWPLILTKNRLSTFSRTIHQQLFHHHHSLSSPFLYHIHHHASFNLVQRPYPQTQLPPFLTILGGFVGIVFELSWLAGWLLMILYKIFKVVYSRRILSQDYVHQTIYDPILRLYSFTSYHRRMIQNLKTFLAITEQDLKHPAFLKQKQDVFYLLLNTKANVFTKDFTRIIHSLLDIVEANQGPTALVTVSLAKLFSGGLDLKYTSGLHEEERRYFIMETITVFGRIAVLPFPTICLVRGGAVAAGCMLAFSHDYVYVSGKAMFSTNQSQNQIPFPPGMMSVIKKRHAYAATARDMILFSKQFVAEKALEGKLIDGIWSQEEAVKKVHDLGSELSSFGDNKVNMRMIKSQLYKQVIEACFGRQLHSYNVVGYNKMAQFAKL